MSPAPHRMTVLRREARRPLPPRVSSFTRPFWDALVEGRLITTCCSDCGRLTFPPKPICRACWSEAIAWRDLAPFGRLYSFTHVHVLPGAFAADALSDIGIVDLDDGPRIMCRLIGDAADFAVDMAVEMITVLYDDGPLFAARPRSGP